MLNKIVVLNQKLNLDKFSRKAQKISSNKEYKVYSKKLNIWRESAIVFEEIYGKSSHSFWLDSSMVAEGLSRFSYMGDSEGDKSFLVEYDVNKEEIKIINKIILIFNLNNLNILRKNKLTIYTANSV